MGNVEANKWDGLWKQGDCCSQDVPLNGEYFEGRNKGRVPHCPYPAVDEGLALAESRTKIQFVIRLLMEMPNLRVAHCLKGENWI
jgi:hypothetical protein